MPSYTYTGPEDEISLRGVTFPKGVPVPIDDKGFEAKLDNLPYFDTDKPEAAKAAPAAFEKPETEREAELKRKVAALEAENATLRKRIVELSEPEPEATPVEVTPEEEVISEYTPGETEPAAEDDPDLDIPHRGAAKPQEIEIPEDWRDMHWKRQQVLARKLTDMEITNQEDAVTAIEMELERRGDQ